MNDFLRSFVLLIIFLEDTTNVLFLLFVFVKKKEKKNDKSLFVIVYLPMGASVDIDLSCQDLPRIFYKTYLVGKECHDQLKTA